MTNDVLLQEAFEAHDIICSDQLAAPESEMTLEAETKARSSAMHTLTEEHNSPHKVWCCVKNVALRRGPELDSEKIPGQQLEKGTHVEARHSPNLNCPSRQHHIIIGLSS